VLQRLLPGGQPERCVEAYYLQRSQFESIAEGKLRRQLTEDGKVEITGRDLRKGPSVAIGSRPPNGSIRPFPDIRPYEIEAPTQRRGFPEWALSDFSV
jgi:hypothetical protein